MDIFAQRLQLVHEAVFAGALQPQGAPRPPLAGASLSALVRRAADASPDAVELRRVWSVPRGVGNATATANATANISLAPFSNRSLLPPGWRTRIATAPMQLFNSPWGSFIRHVWGGPGAELRRRVFDDELRVQGVWRRKQFERLVEQAQATWIDMEC